MGYFYWLRIKNSKHLHRELSLGYLEDTKFYLESKASFIHISSIASFKPFLIAWLWGYCTFLDSSVVSLKSSPQPKYTKHGTIFKKKSCSTIKLFFFFKYVIYQTVLRKYLKKKSGVTVLLSSQTGLKGGQGFDIAVRMENLRVGDWNETQNGTFFSFSSFLIADQEAVSRFAAFLLRMKALAPQKRPLFVLLMLAGRTAAILDVAMLCAEEVAQCKTRESP